MLYVAVIKIVAPFITHAEIIDAIESACASCEIEVDRVTFGLFSPLDISILDLKLKVGYEGGSEALVRIPSTRLDISGSRSSRGHFVIEKVLITDPVITFVDGDAVSRKSKRRKEPSETTVEIEKTLIERGEFIYVRNTHGTSATLNMRKIEATIGPLKITGRSKEQEAVARVGLQIENSGHVELEVKAKLGGPIDHVDVGVAIRDQKLSDLNKFFEPNAGVSLQGTMAKARGWVQVRGDKSKAAVWVVYHGLKLELKPMYDRSEVTAFFMNFGADLVMEEEDLGQPKSDQTKVLDVPRGKGERIIGYILRGLKEAAIKVARK
jgi:hypothetical protein